MPGFYNSTTFEPGLRVTMVGIPDVEDMAVERTTQSEERVQARNGGYDTQPLPAEPVSSVPPTPPDPPVPPATSAPPAPTHAAPIPTQSTAPGAPGGFDHCPSCGALVASDQRYCLACGHRRGDPRLPFMDAVVFMDAMNRPPETAGAPKKQPRKISPNAALIAGVGTLLLALGIGVLIGRSGNHTSGPASQTPIVIKGGAGEEAAKTASAGTTIGGGKGAEGPKKTVVKQKKKEAESGKGAEEVLKPVDGVTMPPATAKVGEKCQKDVAGCNTNGEFDGSYFGEE